MCLKKSDCANVGTWLLTLSVKFPVWGKDTGLKIFVQDKPCIWRAGGAAFSLPHYVYRSQRSSMCFSNNDFTFRAIFSLLLGSNEDRLKAPEGLHHWRLWPSNPDQRLEWTVLEQFFNWNFYSPSAFWTSREARHSEGGVWAGYRPPLLPLSSHGWGAYDSRIFLIFSEQLPTILIV